MDLLSHSGGTPLHIHPFTEESYDVLQGTFEVNIGGVKNTAAAGERVVVPKGVAHTFRNTSNETATV
jgi:quercetin dioxygenase-like cupin family protein